jgi:hypothetical protein
MVCRNALQYVCSIIAHASLATLCRLHVLSGCQAAYDSVCSALAVHLPAAWPTAAAGADMGTVSAASSGSNEYDKGWEQRTHHVDDPLADDLEAAVV